MEWIVSLETVFVLAAVEIGIVVLVLLICRLFGVPLPPWISKHLRGLDRDDETRLKRVYLGAGRYR